VRDYSGCGCAVVLVVSQIALAVYFTFFNRYCIFPECKVCPHVTLWEYWTSE
jgi:hypothetical protein